MASTSNTRPRPATRLSTDRILELAVGICERDGFESISMRRLADELSVTPMALYGHIETKHQLLELIANRYLADLDLAADATSWTEQLGRIFRSFHEIIVAHPVVAHVLTTQPVDGPSAHAMADVALGVLRSHGFEDREAIEVFGVLASFTVGYTLSQTARRATLTESRTKRKARLGAASDVYPNLSALADKYVDWPSTDAFGHGLDFLLDSYAKVHG